MVGVQRLMFWALMLGIVAAGCSRGGGDTERGLLKARLEAIEQRLAALEKQSASYAEVHAGLEDLERRVAAAEARAARAVEWTAPPPTTPRGSGDPPPQPQAVGRRQAWEGLQGPGGESRRVALMALGAEYKERVARAREEYGDPSGSPEGRQAFQEAQQWYHEQLRSLATEREIPEVSPEAPGK